MPSHKYPPATNTVPSSSAVAEWPARRADMSPVGVNLPVEGSNSSALAVVEYPHLGSLQARLSPPAIRTVPSGNNVAECLKRGRVIDAVAVNLPVTTS